MYLPFSELKGFAIVGHEVGAADTPAPLGTLDDLHVDVRDWRIVGLVVAAGGPLSSRRALLGTERPVAFDLARRELRVEWTSYDVETAPDADATRTVADLDAGDGPGADGGLAFGPGDPFLPDGGGQAVLGGDPDAVVAPPTEQERHLHRASDLQGCEVSGEDDAVGRVTDLLVDRDSPRVAWLVVDAGSWLAGREVVLDPAWVSDGAGGEVDDGARPARTLAVGLTREQVRGAPPLEGLDGLDHAYGAALAAFYRFVD